MKKALPMILFLLAVVLAAAFSYEVQQVSHLRQLIGQMEKDASAARGQAEADSADLRKMKEQVKTYKLSVSQLETLIKDTSNGKSAGSETQTTLGEKSVNDDKGSGGMMKSLAKMFNDPKMKDMMRAQQAAGVNMIYGNLAKELGLSPDEAKQVLGVLADRQTEMAAKGLKAFGNGAVDSKALAESGKDTETASAAFDTQLKNVLGPEKFGKFQEFEKTIGERLALDQIQHQLTAGGTPLEPDQSKSLLEIMKQERLAGAPSAFDPGNRNAAAQAQILQSDEALQTLMQEQQDRNRRVLERARTVLSPDQMLALETAQKQQLDMQQMGIKMSREFLKGGSK